MSYIPKMKNSKQRKAEKFRKDQKDIEKKYGTVREKPQIKYKFLREKLMLNKRVGPTKDVHPYSKQISQWSITTSQRTKSFQISMTSPELIDNKYTFHRMINHLNAQHTITIDFEHTHNHTYHGMICLIQISTWRTDYIVDPFVLRHEIREHLKHIFESPKILKIIHGGQNDFKLLQKEFNIFTFPVLDTQLIYKHWHQDENYISFKDLLKWTKIKIPEDAINKELQIADWRVRPLPKEYLKYAQADTHYLYKAWEHIKSIIFKDKVTDPGFAFVTSIAQMRQIHEFRVSDAERDWRKLTNQPPIEFHPLFIKMCNLRNVQAQIYDETPNNIIHRNTIADLIQQQSIDMRKLKQYVPRSSLLQGEDMENMLLILNQPKHVEEIEERAQSPIPTPTREVITVTITNPSPEPNFQTFEEEMLEIFAPEEEIMDTELQITVISCNKCLSTGHTGSECWEPRNKQIKKDFKQLNPESRKISNLKRKQNWRKNQKLKKLKLKQ